MNISRSLAIYLYPGLIWALWIAWVAYWQVASSGNKPTVRREAPASRASHIAPLLAGVILLIERPSFTPWLASAVLPADFTTYWIGVALIAGGLGFAVWARRHLGSNWSGTVTVKQEHQLICTGPYGRVRHPIYTGLLLALLGSAVARADIQGFIGFAICVAALIRKLRIEERWMLAQFGTSYSLYVARTRALLPLLY
ncbi:MAG: methyltransferase family protein [Steroidobacteraceae bacterium]